MRTHDPIVREERIAEPAYDPAEEQRQKSDNPTSKVAGELSDTLLDFVSEQELLRVTGQAVMRAASYSADLAVSAAQTTGEILGGAVELVGDVVGSILD